MEDSTATRQTTLALLHKYQSLILEKKFDEWIELWADDGVCEFPFAPEGHARRLVGKAEILDYMTSYPGQFEISGVREMRVHPTVDPNVAAVEASVEGTAVQTGRPYHQSYVVFLEAANGKVARYREYWNPLVTMEALGGLEAWLGSGFGPQRGKGAR